MDRRASGILLHVTSLPSPLGIGDLGPGAYQFVDFLAETRQRYWQILPLNPTDLEHGNSPYHSSSAFALNPLFISPELLVQDGLLHQRDLEPIPEFPANQVNYPSVIAYKQRLLDLAHDRFKDGSMTQHYDDFCSQNAHWLEDFALFVALKSKHQGQSWIDWPEKESDRAPEILNSARAALKSTIEKGKFFQFVIWKQWMALKNYCNEKGIKFFGDIPIYIIIDSADIWVNPDIVELGNDKRPLAVAGVPPDYFSETGQLWGNPVYKWNRLKDRGYDWWLNRISHNLKLFDLIRIDHFRGFVGYWEVPAHEKNAVNGKWAQGPADHFFEVLLREIPQAPIIAEDLGVITPDVKDVMKRFGFPGMKVLLFAFGEDLAANPYAPHNHVRNCVVYTGTHDNNTTRGWFDNEISTDTRQRLYRYLGKEAGAEEIHWELIRLAMMSVANTAIIPMQDILGLGEEARMNLPATTEGNWRWRLLPEQLTPDLAACLREMTETYGRA